MQLGSSQALSLFAVLCDYDLFPKIKEPLRGIRYDDLDEMYAAVNGLVRGTNRHSRVTKEMGVHQTIGGELH